MIHLHSNGNIYALVESTCATYLFFCFRGWTQTIGNKPPTCTNKLTIKCLGGVAHPLISPRTASDIECDLFTVLTNCGRIGLRVTTHAYVPLSIKELRGENTTDLTMTLLVGLCSFEVTRPGTPENRAPSLVHLLVTITSLSVIPPLRVITQLRVKLLPA